MVFINGKCHEGNVVIGPRTSDQEIKMILQNSKNRDLTAEGLTELRTACIEYRAQVDPIYRSPFTAV